MSKFFKSSNDDSSWDPWSDFDSDSDSDSDSEIHLNIDTDYVFAENPNSNGKGKEEETFDWKVFAENPNSNGKGKEEEEEAFDWTVFADDVSQIERNKKEDEDEDLMLAINLSLIEQIEKAELLNQNPVHSEQTSHLKLEDELDIFRQNMKREIDEKSKQKSKQEMENIIQRTVEKAYQDNIGNVFLIYVQNYIKNFNIPRCNLCILEWKEKCNHICAGYLSDLWILRGVCKFTKNLVEDYIRNEKIKVELLWLSPSCKYKIYPDYVEKFNTHLLTGIYHSPETIEWGCKCFLFKFKEFIWTSKLFSDLYKSIILVSDPYDSHRRWKYYQYSSIDPQFPETDKNHRLGYPRLHK